MRWSGLPVLLRAVLLGALVASAALFLNPWLLLNIRLSPRLPWAPFVVALFLWLLWQYLGGRWAPQSTSQSRRLNLRGRLPQPRVWRWSMTAGLLATVSLRSLLDIARRLLQHPEQDMTPPHVLNQFPFFTILLLLLTAAAIAGVVEEAAFRGYMQAPLERRYGPGIAITITGIIFVLAHYRFGPDPRPWLIFSPMYFAAAVAWGRLAYLSGSIVPGVICHTLLDATAFMLYWRLGIPRNIWEVGIDSSFRIRLVVAVAFAALAWFAYRKLAQVAGETSPENRAAGANAG